MEGSFDSRPWPTADLDKSDYMLHTNIAETQFKEMRQNDKAFIYQMSRTAPRCSMDRGREFSLWADNYKTKTPFCNGCTATRGGNHSKQGCLPSRSCPHPEYSRQYMGEFLLVPCPKPTHKNYIVCERDENFSNNSELRDCGKCCSKRHQLFKNVTKRKDITSYVQRR